MPGNKPEEVCRELIHNLQNGMGSLSQFAMRAENYDPNTRVVRVNDVVTGEAQYVHERIANDFDAQSIKSGVSYNWSAVGEMNNDELDKLKSLNEKKMDEIESKYHERNKEILTAKQIMRGQKEHF